MTTVKSKKEAMRPRQHDTKAEVRDARGHKMTKAEIKERDRIHRILDEQHLRRAHRKAMVKARNASRQVFADAMVRLDSRARASADKETLDIDWAEIYSAARAVGHQADKLAAVKEVLRLEKAMKEKGYTVYKEKR